MSIDFVGSSVGHEKRSQATVPSPSSCDYPGQPRIFYIPQITTLRRSAVWHGLAATSTALSIEARPPHHSHGSRSNPEDYRHSSVKNRIAQKAKDLLRFSCDVHNVHRFSWIIWLWESHHLLYPRVPLALSLGSPATGVSPASKAKKTCAFLRWTGEGRWLGNAWVNDSQGLFSSCLFQHVQCLWMICMITLCSERAIVICQNLSPSPESIFKIIDISISYRCNQSTIATSDDRTLLWGYQQTEERALTLHA